MDGRDIGTVICPDAEVKLFVTASAETRAARRHQELTGNGIDTAYQEVLADVKARDARDMGRAEAPLKPAQDAAILDTTRLSIEDAVAQAVSVISEAVRHASDPDLPDRDTP